MKKITFLTGFFLYSFNCLGQQQETQIDFNHVVNIGIPKSAQKISKQDALLYAAKAFNNEKVIVNSIAGRKENNMYIIDNVLVSIHTDDRPVKKGHLEEIKKGMDELFKDDKTYSSQLKTIDDGNILILRYEVNTVGIYRFFSYNNSYTKAVTGTIEFNRTDNSRVVSIVENISKSIKYQN